MRKWLVVVCSLVVTALAQSSAQSPSPSPNSAGPAPSVLIMGRVIDDVTKEPLPDAAVIARVAGAVVDQVRTNRDGVFVLPAVPTGDVSIGVELPGYLGSGGAAAPGAGARPVVLRASAGQRIVDAVIPLRRFLAIGGTVRDEAGEPVVDVAVGVQLQVERGQWTPLATVRTDDRGMYRFGQLSAGQYRVMVSPTVAAVPHTRGGARRVMYPATYAPSARTPQDATIIALKPGSDRNAVDVSLAPVGEVRVAGRLVAADSAAVSSVPIRLIAADAGGLSQPLTAATATTDASGRFEFPRVPAGRYRLYMYQQNLRRLASTAGTVEIATSSERLAVRNGAAAAPTPQPPSPIFWADMPVRVEDTDIVDLDVPVGIGFRPSGRAVFDGTAEKPAQVLLTFQRVDVALWPMAEARVTADGTLQSDELAPGRYIIFARTGSGAWQLRSADYRGVNIADLPVDVREPLTDVVLIFTDKQSSVSGAVRDSRGTAVSSAAVVIFPADRRLWNVATTSWRMKIARTTQAGEFTLRNLPAGDYLCAALADEASTNWNDVERLAELAPRATKVVLAEGQPARLDLTLLAAGSLEMSPEPADGHGPFVDDELQVQRAALARASISGVVREQATGRAPLRGVTVELQGANDNVRATTYTDAAGRFAFADLAPGPYRVFFSKPAYLRAEYGAKRMGGPGTSVVVANADVAIETSIARGAVISGRVSNARGRPLNWTTIALVGVREVAGQPQLLSITSAMPKEVITDDRGEYRIYGLAPGTYFVAATPGGGGGAFSGRPTTDADIARAKDGTASTELRRVPVESFAPTFFPAAREFAGAQPITVAAGQERLGVDVTMGLSPVAKLSGSVLASNGRPAMGAQLAVFPVGPYVPNADVVLSSAATGEATSGGGSVRTSVGQGGIFAISGLTPGQYTVFVRAAGTGAGVSEFALTTVAVGDFDPPPVSLTLKPAPRVSGSVSFDAIDGGDLSRVRIGLSPVENGPLTVSLPPAPVGADGKFVLAGALPGRYWLAATGVPEGFGIVDGLGASGQLQAAPLVVPDAGDLAELKLTLGSAASVVGVFSDTIGVAATDYLVVLFDVDRSRWLPGSPRVQAVRPRSNGEFVFVDVPPGEYRLAAVTDIEPDQWRAPALLEQLISASVTITVRAGQRTTQNLRIAK